MGDYYSYYSTIANVTATVITLVSVFIGYLVQSRDFKDKEKQNIRERFKILNRMLLEFYTLDANSPHADPPEPVTSQDLMKNLDRLARESYALRKIYTDSSFDGNQVDIYNDERYILFYNLLTRILQYIYNEFPKFHTKHKIPYGLVEVDFPSNLKDFSKWHEDIRMFDGNVLSIQRTLIPVYPYLLEFKRREAQDLIDKDKIINHYEIEKRLCELNFYENALDKYFGISREIRTLSNMIEIYREHQKITALRFKLFLRRSVTGLSMMVVSGILFPIYMLYPSRLGLFDEPFISELIWMLLISGLVVTSDAIYREYFKDVLVGI